MKHIYVTGAYGFLGTHTVRLLERKGYSVTPTTKGVNLLDERAVTKDMNMASERKGEIDVAVHLAATVGGIEDNRKYPFRFLRDNILIGLNVLNTCRAFEVPEVITAGSVCSYPLKASQPLQESDIWNGYPEPTNGAYGIAKRVLLEATASLEVETKQAVVGTHLIFANLYGPEYKADASHVIPQLIRKFMRATDDGDDTVTVWGDGTPTRDFLYVEDAAKAILMVIEQGVVFPAINVGSGEVISIGALAVLIAEKVGFNGRIVFDKSKPNGQGNRLLGTEIANAMGWLPQVPFKVGLEMTIDWYKSVQP